MKLPDIRNLQVSGKRVLLRTNFDVPLSDGKVADGSRIDEALPTIDYLLSQEAKIVLLSHLGRPEKVDPAFSLKPVVLYLSKLLGRSIPLLTEPGEIARQKESLCILENLRFFPGEEEDDEQFAYSLASHGEVYVNDAFACSHRKHASIVGLPKFLPSGFGFDALEEITTLTDLYEQPKRPVVLVLGGVKSDKLEIAQGLTSWADWLLLGGNLVGDGERINKEQKIVGKLTADGKDIDEETINRFKEIIKQAKTVVWSGPMGVYESEISAKGTREIAEEISGSDAYTVVGGGDTEAALTKFNLTDKINYISSGGGAMLEFLINGTLPGIEAIKESKK